MIINDLKNFRDSIEGKIYFDHDIKNLNWFNINGKSRIFYKPSDLNELIQFLKIYNSRAKIFIIGAGSNILIANDIFDGVIIKLGSQFSKISKLNDNTLIAGSGVLDKKISDFALENSISGLEFLSCIPGTIGGGIRMNSGCYGNEFKDIVLSVQAIDFNGSILTIPAKEIEFNYRKTNISKNLIFLSATLSGIKDKYENILTKMNTMKENKKKTQPSMIKTGGSTFKNPKDQTDIKVWKLIRDSVPPNISFGDATISSKHRNFFVNKKNANFEDMLRLINFVKDCVKNKFKIQLELELVLIK